MCPPLTAVKTLHGVLKDVLQHLNAPRSQVEQRVTCRIRDYLSNYVNAMVVPSVSYLLARFIRTRSKAPGKEARILSSTKVPARAYSLYTLANK